MPSNPEFLLAGPRHDSERPHRVGRDATVSIQELRLTSDSRDIRRGFSGWGSGSAVDPAAGATVVILSESTELWDLAEAAYGDGVQWKAIALANAGVPDGDGRS